MCTTTTNKCRLSLMHNKVGRAEVDINTKIKKLEMLKEVGAESRLDGREREFQTQ